MKKTLVALAALAVVSAASAQSTVTLYGLVDMGVAQLKDANNTNTALAGIAAGDTSVKNGIQQGTLSNSRIGFKGTEDLGNGLKANFVYELQINPDEGANAMTTRQGTVGLSGNFGAVTIGRQYTPYFVVQNAMDFAGNLNAMPGYIVNNHISDGGRANAVNYTSPSFGGFSAIAQVGAGPVGANTESSVTNGQQADGKNYGLAGIYAAGPLVAGLAYEDVTRSTAALSKYSTITTPTAGVNGQANSAATLVSFGAGSDEVKTWAAGASYDFTVVKASFAYSSLTDTLAGRPDLTSKGYNISLSAPIGAVTVYGNLGRANYQQDATATTVASDASIKGFQLGANYSLSKRTTAYAVVGRDTLTVNSYAPLSTLNGDFTRTATTVGVRHTF